MNLLDVDPRGKLRLEFDDDFRETAENLPTSRYRPGIDIMSIQPLIEVWRQLRPFLDSGTITMTSSAEHLMQRLAVSYRTRRRQIRSAELNFKHEFTGSTIPGMKTVPMEHQVRAWGFASTINAAALLMEQGTAKTYVAIALIYHRMIHNNVKRVLIVTPKCVLPVWPKELAKHADFEYTVDRVPKSSKTAIRIEFGSGIQILMINYDKMTGRKKELIKWKPDMVILDESHRIKNRQAKRSKACHLIGREVQYKLILTGTLLGQRLVDAYSQYLFLDSNVFGRDWKKFEEKHLNMGGYMGYEIKGYKDIDLFAKELHSVAFRCTKKECLDLPEQVDENLYIEPDAKTRYAYSTLTKDLMLEIDEKEISVDLIITLMGKLRQITGGIVRADDNTFAVVSRRKLNVLEEFILNHSFDKKMIIVCSFTHEIEMIKDMLFRKNKGFLVLNGQTPEYERENIEKLFTEDFSVDILIMQVDTGGEGLDFTTADTMVFYSPTFSMIKYYQVKSRIHRIGQTNSVTYYHLLMEGTIDEDILEFIQEYGDITSQILDEKKGYNMESKLEKVLNDIEKDIEKRKPKPKREETTMVKKKADASSSEAKPGYTATDMAAELGIEPPTLRAALRAINAQKPGKSWAWDTAKSAAGLKKEIQEYLKGQKTAGRPPGKKEEVTKKKTVTKKKVVKKKK